MSSQSPSITPALEACAPSDTSVHVRTRALQKPRRDALTRVRHDLRSLVHSVIGYSDLLASPSYGALSPEQTRFVSHVRTAAEQLQELVDTCIELSRPAHEMAALEPALVPLGAALKHVQAGLASASLRCALDVDAAAEQRECALELPLLLRALRGLAQVLSHDGQRALALRATVEAERLVVRLSADGVSGAGPCQQLDVLENDIGNRDFVRLKLSEVLLSRLSMRLELTAGLDRCELSLG